MKRVRTYINSNSLPCTGWNTLGEGGEGTIQHKSYMKRHQQHTIPNVVIRVSFRNNCAYKVDNNHVHYALEMLDDAYVHDRFHIQNAPMPEEYLVRGWKMADFTSGCESACPHLRDPLPFFYDSFTNGCVPWFPVSRVWFPFRLLLLCGASSLDGQNALRRLLLIRHNTVHPWYNSTNILPGHLRTCQNNHFPFSCPPTYTSLENYLSRRLPW